ncbi:MAG TPA: CDP-glycerol glycerophosphotransferase family protein [Micromonosporaceae bacterium]
MYQKVGLNGLPTAALAVVALTRLPWFGYVLCLATLVYGWQMYRLEGLGKHRVGRVLVVSAVLLEVARPGDGDEGLGVPLALTGVLLIGQIAHEQMLSKALMTGRLRTANLGVNRRGIDRVLDSRWAYLATTVLTVLFLVSAAFSWMLWELAVVTVVVTALFIVAVVAAWRERRSAAHQQDAEVHAAVEAIAPTFLVHFSAPPGSEYQILMWLPYLDQIGEPYVVVLREAHALPAISAATDRPVVVAPSIANLEHMLVDSMRTVFYVNNGMKNTHCVRFGHMTHVQVLHGDSDKASSYNPISAMYDRVYVAGQAGVDRYHKHGVRIPTSQFRIVGRPQVAGVEITTQPITAVQQSTVLYAPTWTGNSSDVNYSSLGIGEKILRGLLRRGITVILRPHPYTTRIPVAAQQLAKLEAMLAADAARTGRQHRWGKVSSADMSLLDCINAADAMITDVSAVASDWLYSEKPFASTDMQNEGERFVETFPLSRAAYIVDHKGSNVDEVLDELLGTDPLASIRRDMKTYYLGDFPSDHYVDAFLDEARRCIAGADEVLTGAQSVPSAPVPTAGTTVA